MILEVNNTNDERRIYFLSPTSTIIPPKDPGKANGVRYAGTWEKDFYVSTFNDQSGKYSAAIYDPLAPNMSNQSPGINTTITLSTSDPDSDPKPMLIARLYSTTPALDPEAMSVLEKSRFLMNWWWVGYMTFFPRTVFEAYRLFFRKGVEWVSRPEPRRETMPRHANREEICIERCFRMFLENRVKTMEQDTGWDEGNLGVRYIPAGLVGDFAKEEFYTRLLGEELSEEETIEIRVLTPLFYSRIIQYSNIYAGLLSEIESGTIEISNLELLKYLELDFEDSPTSTGIHSEFFLTRVCLFIIRLLRTSNVAALRSLAKSIEHPDPKSESETPNPITSSLPSHTLSGLDRFMVTTLFTFNFRTSRYIPKTRKEATAYLLSTIKILIAETFFMGWLEIVDFEVFVVRVWVAWTVSSYL